MVAFNFNPVFEEKIKNGEKRSTIRTKQRAEIGDKMQLFVGLRTKSCRKIGDSICIGTATITVTDETPWHIASAIGIVSPTGKPLHEQEGFQNVKEFVDFFRNTYGLPYSGHLHVWGKVVFKSSQA